MTKSCPGAPKATAPSLEMPARACDCHVHVLGPYAQYPLAEDRAYTAPEAALPVMLEMMRVMHLERAVIAHVSAQGTDFRVTLDAIKAMGSRARGTVMLLQSMSDGDLRQFHEQGIRGVRLSHAFGYEVTEDTLKGAAARIAPYGWHIAIWPSSLDELKLIARVGETLPVPIVLDHLANHCWDPKRGINQEGFTLLLSLLASGRAWLKLSGMYRASRGPFPWPELVPFGEKLVSAVPERLLWASDWPHVGVWDDNMPQSHELLDLLPRIGCDRAALQRVLADNPAQLYGFS
jgi:2-pyrone-4,6-dicarboxylate lactonase